MESINIQTIQKYELEMLIEIDHIAKKHNIKYWLAYGTALGAIRHKGFIPWDTDTDIIVSITDYKRFLRALNDNLNEKYTLRHIDYKSDYDSLQPRVTLSDDDGRIIHVDIYPMVGVPKKPFKKSLYRRIAYLNQRLFFVKNVKANVNYKDKFLKRVLAKIIKIILLLIPCKFFLKIDAFLANKYPLNNSEDIFNLYGNYGAKELIKRKWLGDGTFYVPFESSMFPVPKCYDKYLTHFYDDYMTPKKDNYI